MAVSFVHITINIFVYSVNEANDCVSYRAESQQQQQQHKGPGISVTRTFKVGDQIMFR